MSSIHRFSHYVPVTSYPNTPVDRSFFPADLNAGTEWGRGSAFDYSAKLRFNDDQSGLTIQLLDNTNPLPRKRIILEAQATIEQNVREVGPYPSQESVLDTDTYLVPSKISWKVKTTLPKTRIAQDRNPTRTYDYVLEGADNPQS